MGTIGNYVYSTRAIGKGTLSQVYKGFDTTTDIIVAIKIIDKLSLTKDSVSRIVGESKMMRQLVHPNIAVILDFIQDENYFYMILEYCAGGDLYQFIRKGKLPEETARKFMFQISKALGYLKSKNILHRDLKPQNILLTKDCKTVKLTDFNFSREMAENDLAHTFCGSPLYMAPEIMENQTYTVKADLWSVGMILYEMIYGNNPFCEANGIIDLIKRVNTQAIPISNAVSEECNSLIKGLLRKSPDERMDWDTFLNNPWISQSHFVAPLSADRDLFLSMGQPFENVDLSESKANHMGAFRIGQGIFTPPPINIVDNYVPTGISPPKYTRSEPIIIKTVRREEAYASSAPNKIWGYMGTLRGYISPK